MNQPSWLVDDLLRVESILLDTAGASPHPLVKDPALHLIQAGGKRLRPALVQAAARSGAPTRATDLSAAAVELIHLATLYHDDVVDETETRRGVATVHAQWGTEVAVLVGDYLFAQGCLLGAQAGGDVPSILAAALADVCEGQIVETAALFQSDRRTEEYIETVTKKTAALFGAACEMGAVTAGVTPEVRAALLSYGTHLGIAFQIVDDLLDFVGDPRVTGKTPGTDLDQGVYTLPVLIATERDASLKSDLTTGDHDLERVLDAMRRTGALETAHETAGQMAATALGALQVLHVGEPRTTLETIVTGVLAQTPEPLTA
ncbi:MAG: polyprenyl synthetase family protein [Actinomycetota bacterium]